MDDRAGLDGLEHFTLSANIDTDKKHSALNTLHTRGKRVVAEVTVPAPLIERVMHTTGRELYRQRQLSNVGSLLARAVNNGAHYANGIAAMFIACGQDMANVAEAAAGNSYTELRDNGTTSSRSPSPPSSLPMWRRNGTAHTTRVPRGAGLLRTGQRAEVRRDRGGHGAVRRTLPRLGHCLRAVGVEPRIARPEPAASFVRRITQVRRE